MSDDPVGFTEHDQRPQPGKSSHIGHLLDHALEHGGVDQVLWADLCEAARSASPDTPAPAPSFLDGLVADAVWPVLINSLVVETGGGAELGLGKALAVWSLTLLPHQKARVVNALMHATAGAISNAAAMLIGPAVKTATAADLDARFSPRPITEAEALAALDKAGPLDHFEMYGRKYGGLNMQPGDTMSPAEIDALNREGANTPSGRVDYGGTIPQHVLDKPSLTPAGRMFPGDLTGRSPDEIAATMGHTFVDLEAAQAAATLTNAMFGGTVTVKVNPPTDLDELAAAQRAEVIARAEGYHGLGRSRETPLSGAENEPARAASDPAESPAAEDRSATSSVSTDAHLQTLPHAAGDGLWHCERCHAHGVRDDIMRQCSNPDCGQDAPACTCAGDGSHAVSCALYDPRGPLTDDEIPF